ncbi:MAG TPA: hypothetical protein VNN17_09025 [Terriglobia bacterium]|nr:hypothetical protein [Terriglobia bacterium]
MLALLLFTPVVLTVDTRSRDARLRWSFLLSGAVPLPGTKGQTSLALAGVPLWRPQRKEPAPASKTERVAIDRPEQHRQRRRKMQRALWECLWDGDLRAALAKRFQRLPADLWKAMEIRRWESTVSLPEPALNGMLWGALAAVPTGARARFECNFIGRNQVRTELRFYPYRIVQALLIFLLRLPYRALCKRWRAA